MLEIQTLNKSFGKKAVLNGLSFRFENGIYGLLGPNGSGKTTLIRCIVGLYSVKNGVIIFDGKPARDSNDYLSKVGYLSQNFGMFKELSVSEMLLLMANLKGIDEKKAKEDIEEVLEKVNLSDCLQKKVGTLSGGMVRRLGIAQALLGDPELVIFDEPTAGLDPEERLRFKNLISQTEKNKTIIISTHIVEDVESLCDYVAIMKEGKIAASGTCGDIEKCAENKVFAIPESEISSVKEEYFVQKYFTREDKRYVRVLSHGISGYEPISPDVEDGYMCVLKGI